MKKIAFFLMLISVIIAGCSQNGIKENQVYVISDNTYLEEQQSNNLNIEGRIPFQKYIDNSLLIQLDPNQVLLTISPDGKDMYLMEPIATDGFPQVINGEPGESVRIIRENITTKAQKIVIEDIPFVSKVLWNNKGNMVAFGGREKLTIYDVENEIPIMKRRLEQDTVTNFYWSPVNENKLYSEQSDLANGSIYYLASQKKVEAYETREETYYKGKLDDSYYYGTKWDLTNGDTKTVILDKQGKTIKDLIPGRFRDAYQKSLIVIDDRGFGLYYVRDINKPEEAITLSKEYVYDVKFVAGGKIAYTTKAEDIETNLFYLHLTDNMGKQLKRYKVQGGQLMVSPDGSFGYISGPEWQRVDFVQNTLEPDIITVNEKANELQDIYTTIRGAMTIFYDFQLMGKQSNNLNKYFTKTHSPDQWAHFDMELIFQERSNRPLTENYNIDIYLKNYDIKAYGKNAAVTIGVNIKNPHGRGDVMDYALELTKIQANWYVTGFSTFPNSIEHKEIEKIVQETITSIQAGDLFTGELKGKEITMGQIQFWLSGMPHLAPSVESANSAKVYLHVSDQGMEEIYKLVLEKVNQSHWKPVKLSKEDLSSL